jgi:hypothetical protein
MGAMRVATNRIFTALSWSTGKVTVVCARSVTLGVIELRNADFLGHGLQQTQSGYKELRSASFKPSIHHYRPTVGKAAMISSAAAPVIDQMLA